MTISIFVVPTVALAHQRKNDALADRNSIALLSVVGFADCKILGTEIAVAATFKSPLIVSMWPRLARLTVGRENIRRQRLLNTRHLNQRSELKATVEQSFRF